jgi:hypothetical protein
MWRCVYCHNPDTWTMSNGIPVTVERASEELEKYRHGLKVMAGGFTLSGGEPLMQHRFAVKLFQAARGHGIHTALDTNGYYGDRLTDAELELVDLVLLDLKAWDPDRHRRITAMPVQPTLDFARRLAFHKRPLWVRFVLVPGLRRSRRDREDRGIRGLARQRRTRRRPPLPSAGQVQVGEAGDGVRARRRRSALERGRRPGVRRVPRGRLEGVLIDSSPGVSPGLRFRGRPGIRRLVPIQNFAYPTPARTE